MSLILVCDTHHWQLQACVVHKTHTLYGMHSDHGVAPTPTACTSASTHKASGLITNQSKPTTPGANDGTAIRLSHGGTLTHGAEPVIMKLNVCATDQSEKAESCNAPMSHQLASYRVKPSQNSLYY